MSSGNLISVSGGGGAVLSQRREERLTNEKRNGVAAEEWSAHSGDVRGRRRQRRWPPPARQRGHGAMESDSPARLSGTYPVTLPLLLHCVDAGVPLTP